MFRNAVGDPWVPAAFFLCNREFLEFPITQKRSAKDAHAFAKEYVAKMRRKSGAEHRVAIFFVLIIQEDL